MNSNTTLSFFKSVHSHNGGKFTLVNLIVNYNNNPKNIIVEIYGSNNYKHNTCVKINSDTDDGSHICTFIVNKGITYFIKLKLEYNDKYEEYLKFYTLADDYNEINNNISNNIEMKINKVRQNNENDSDDSDDNESDSDENSDSNSDSNSDNSNKNSYKENSSYLNLISSTTANLKNGLN